MKAASKKRFTAPLIFLSFIFLLFIVFAGGYYIFISKSYTSYEKALLPLADKINTVNKSTSVFIKNDSINADLAKKELPQKIDALIKVRTSLETLSPAAKYQKSQDSLKAGLNDNIMMYKQIAAILNSPESKDVEKSITDLQSYRENCINEYTAFQVKDIDINLPETSLDFVENFISYTSKNIRSKKDNDIKKTQALEFTNKLDSATNKLGSLLVDFSTKLPKVRSGSMSYDDLLSDLDNNKDSLMEFKKELSAITVPSDSISLTKLLSSAENYDLYLQDFKYNLTNEKLQSSSASNTQSSNNYPSSSEKFDAASKDYNDFMDLYSDYKNSIKK